jgi:Spy/CpxP family protein refolding chaperone
MRTNLLHLATLTVALLALGTSLSAQGRGQGCGSGRREGRGFMGMNLSDAQQTQMKAIHDKHQAALRAKMEAAETARTSMYAAMSNAGTDAKTLKTMHEKVSAAQFDLMLEHRAVQQEILPLLSPEQKLQFEKHPMGMGPMGGRGGWGPGSGSGFGPGHSGMRHDGSMGMGPRDGRGMGSGPGNSGMRPDCPRTQPN